MHPSHYTLSSYAWSRGMIAIVPVKNTSRRQHFNYYVIIDVVRTKWFTQILVNNHSHIELATELFKLNFWILGSNIWYCSGQDLNFIINEHVSRLKLSKIKALSIEKLVVLYTRTVFISREIWRFRYLRKCIIISGGLLIYESQVAKT